MGYVSAAQRKAVWASKKDGGKGNPNKKSPNKALGVKTIGEKSPMLGKISASCKARAKKKFKVYEKYTKIFLTNVFKNLDFYLNRNNPKSFVLSITLRNRMSNYQQIYHLSVLNK